MRTILFAVMALALSGCLTLKMEGRSACVVVWTKEFADALAKEADALSKESALRVALAEYVEVRNQAPRC